MYGKTENYIVHGCGGYLYGNYFCAGCFWYELFLGSFFGVAVVFTLIQWRKIMPSFQLVILLVAIGVFGFGVMFYIILSTWRYGKYEDLVLRALMDGVGDF